jgi:hypothetical protein
MARPAPPPRASYLLWLYTYHGSTTYLLLWPGRLRRLRHRAKLHPVRTTRGGLPGRDPGHGCVAIVSRAIVSIGGSTLGHMCARPTDQPGGSAAPYSPYNPCTPSQPLIPLAPPYLPTHAHPLISTPPYRCARPADDPRGGAATVQLRAAFTRRAQPEGERADDPRASGAARAAAGETRAR